MLYRIFILVALFSNLLFSQSDDFYFSAKYRATNWVDFDEDIKFYENTHKIMDFSLNIIDEFDFGASFILDEKEQEFTDYAIRLGYEDWGMTVEKGKISGEFSWGESFNSDYTRYLFYKDLLKGEMGKFSGTKLGLGYIEHIRPASYNEYSDMKTKIYGLYFGVDLFTTTLGNEDMAIFGPIVIHPEVLLGYGGVSFKDVAEGAEDFVPGIAFYTANSIAYMLRFEFSGVKFGLSAGIEYGATGLLFSFVDIKTSNGISFDNYDHQYWGPFLRAGIIF
jgi:hypothetical protein